MTPDQRDSATKIINWLGTHPWAVTWGKWGVIVIVAAWFVRNLLKGAYPADRGVPPRWVSALMLALAPAALIVKGVGRWLAGKLSWFGFDFLDEKTLTDSVRVVADKAKGPTLGGDA